MSIHIFIFVRHRDLHFTLLLDLFRQVKANKLLMNRSVKYSPPAQLPIQMRLISAAFCAVCSFKAPDSGLQASGLGRDKHPQPRVSGTRWSGEGDQRKSGDSRFLSPSLESGSLCAGLVHRGGYKLGNLSLTRGPAKRSGPEPSLSFSDPEGKTSQRRGRTPGPCGSCKPTLPLKSNPLGFSVSEKPLLSPLSAPPQ